MLRAREEVRTNPSPGDGFMQKGDDVVALHPLALESLGPGGEGGARQAVLAAGEGEGEAQRQLAPRQVVLLHEAEDAVRYVVKQLQQPRETAMMIMMMIILNFFYFF